MRGVGVVGGKRVRQFGEHLSVERVQGLRTVERDERHGVVLFDEDGFVSHSILRRPGLDPGLGFFCRSFKKKPCPGSSPGRQRVGSPLVTLRQRREDRIDIGVVYIGLPARGVVLVDDDRADALDEIGV